VSRRFGGLRSPFSGRKLAQQVPQPPCRTLQIMLAGTGDREQLAGQPIAFVGAQLDLAKPLCRLFQGFRQIGESPCCVGIRGHRTTMADEAGRAEPGPVHANRTVDSGLERADWTEPLTGFDDGSMPDREALRARPLGRSKKGRVTSVTLGTKRRGELRVCAAFEARHHDETRHQTAVQEGVLPLRTGSVAGRSGERDASYAEMRSSCPRVMSMSSSPSSNRQRV